MSIATINAAAEYFGVPFDAIIGKRRTRQFVIARNAISYIMRERDGWPLSVIGRRLGGRDHTTILHQITLAKSMLADDPHFAAFIDAQMALPKFNVEPLRLTAPPEVQPKPDATATNDRESPGGMKKVHFLHYPMTIDGDGFGVDDHEWRGNLQRASKQLAVALRREHPERCAA